MSQLTIRGLVSLESGEFPIAGVTVVAMMTSDESGSYESLRMQLGRAVTDNDGAFTIETDPEDPRISRWACMLRNCGEFKYQLTYLDRDEAVLHETEPLF